MDNRARAAAGLDRRAFLAGAVAAAFAVACGSGDGAGTAAATGPARFVARGPNAERWVALTFHTDGDLGLANQLLSTLKARDVVMTSFVVGQWLDANPKWAKKLTDAGHELANHTYTHPSFATLSAAAMADEITRCRDVLERLTGEGGRYFRPSGTGDGTERPARAVLATAGDAGYPVVLGFDVDPLDYEQPGADVVVQRTLDEVKAGSIVSLHFGYPGTIAALPRILDGLEQRRLTPVTVSRLLAA